MSRCINRKSVIFRLCRRRIVRSNFRLLTGFSSFLSMPVNRGNEARVYGQNQVIASASCLWETRIDPIVLVESEYLAAARRRRSVGRNRIGEAWTEGTAEGCPGYAHRGIGTRDATAPKKADASGKRSLASKKKLPRCWGSLCRAWTTTSTTDGSGRDILSGCGNRRVMPSIRSRSFVAVSPPAAPANGGMDTACIASGLERRRAPGST